VLSPRSLPVRVLRKLNHHRTTELYFVGYPKTGNTWTRYMLGRYVQLVCGLPYLPLFDATDRMGCCERFCVGPAMHFTHRPLLWHDQKASDLNFENVIRPYIEKRVSLLIRHPLDTLVSLWMQRLHRVHDGYTGTLTQMIEDPVWGIEKLFRFYELWFEHHGRVKDFLLVRYEDMRADPETVFRGILDYLEISPQDDGLRQAVADADFESMKKVELSGEAPKYPSSGYSMFANGDLNNADALHVRRGAVGGFYDYLQRDEAGRLLDLINRRLSVFYGYSNGS
jgi:hypothetical protein